MSSPLSKSAVLVITIDSVVAIVGFVLSFALVWIIYKKNVWNDINYLILSTSVAEVIFFGSVINFALPFISNDNNNYNNNGIIGLEMISAVSILYAYCSSSIMSYIITHLLTHQTLFKLSAHPRILMATILIPQVIWLPISCVGLLYDDAKLYTAGLSVSFYLILVCIVFNFCCYFMQRSQVSKMYNLRLIKLTKHDVAIITLVERLKWYPICQVVARIFPTWWNIQYPNFETHTQTLKPNDSYYMAIFLLHLIFLLVTPVGFLSLYLGQNKNSVSTFSTQPNTSDRSRSSEEERGSEEAKYTINMLPEQDTSSISIQFGNSMLSGDDSFIGHEGTANPMNRNLTGTVSIIKRDSVVKRDSILKTPPGIGIGIGITAVDNRTSINISSHNSSNASRWIHELSQLNDDFLLDLIGLGKNVEDKDKEMSKIESI